MSKCFSGSHPLTSPALTGDWERRLGKIEHGGDSRPKFMEDIAEFTRQTVLELDKLKDAGRDEAPFELVVDEHGGERRYLARAVIDASGTWTRRVSGVRMSQERSAIAPNVMGRPGRPPGNVVGLWTSSHGFGIRLPLRRV